MGDSPGLLSLTCPECGSWIRDFIGRVPGDPLDFSHHDYWCENHWHKYRPDVNKET